MSEEVGTNDEPRPAASSVAGALAGVASNAAETAGAVAGVEVPSEQEEPLPAPKPDKSPVAVPRRRKIKTEQENRRRRRRASATTSEDEGDSKPRRKPPNKVEEPGPEDEEKLAQWAKILNEAKTVRERQPWWKFWKWRPSKKEKIDKPEKPPKKAIVPRVESPNTWRDLVRDARSVWTDLVWDTRLEVDKIISLRNRCMGELLLILCLCGMGAFTFRFTEATFEALYKCGVKRVKRDFVEDLWKSSQFMREDEWKSKARRRLMELEEQLSTAFEAGISSYSGHRTWTFINALLYSFTVITSIGYGHIAPATTTGKALTIVYALIGIPLFLILLADFGKLFTRCIKWVWAFVRRVYYTGSCKKVRKTAPVQEVMKGVQLVYDIAAFRRPSQIPDGNPQQLPEDGTLPPTPAPSNYVIDDEFNLPISVAIFVLIGYIFCGAVVFYIWEDWTFFESFYFVFISMSTIGFGDYVPQNKMYMMASIVYLAFGLALTSMCINVVQEMLSDTFRQASMKIATTIGLKIEASKDGTGGTVTPTHVELAQIHSPPTQL